MFSLLIFEFRMKNFNSDSYVSNGIALSLIKYIFIYINFAFFSRFVVFVSACLTKFTAVIVLCPAALWTLFSPNSLHKKGVF